MIPAGKANPPSINSLEWWNSYFEQHWETNHGPAQTRHFMRFLISGLSAPERAYLSSGGPSVLDWGCAFGDGVDEIKRSFPRVRAAGLDFSPAAIQRARMQYPEIEFIQSDREIPSEFDVIVTSNCLEHFENPLEICVSHLKSCRMLYMVLVPFEESSLIEHDITRFSAESFPESLGRFRRIHTHTALADPSLWNGQQILVIYASPEYLMIRERWLAVSAEQKKWTVYYESLQLEQPEQVLELGQEFLSCVERLLPEGGRVLEAGCGAGWQSLALAKSGRFQVDLLDFSDVALNAARTVFDNAKCSARFLSGNAFDIGKPEYDLVFNSGVIEHYHFDQQVHLLRGMASRSRHHVVVLAPNRHCYWYWISRIHNAAAANWPFGAEVPIIDFRRCFEAAGLAFGGQAYLGRRWTELLISNLSAINPELRETILLTHRSHLMSSEQACYVLAGCGTVGGTEAEPAPGSGNAIQELSASLCDALAVRIAGERSLDRERSRADAAESRLRQVLEQIKLNDETLERVIRRKTFLDSEVQRFADERNQVDEELRRTRELLQDAMTQRTATEATLDRALIEKAASEAEAKTQKEQAQRIAQTFSESTSRFSEAFEGRLHEHRAQRAWQVMLAVRRAYTLAVRHGWVGRLRLLFGPREPLNHYELIFPRPQEYFPAISVAPSSSRVPAPDVVEPLPRKYDVVVLAIIDFDFRFQRPQQIAARFARNGHRVLWVTATRTLGNDSPAAYETRELRENIWEVRLRAPALDLYLKEFFEDSVADFSEALRAVYRDFAIADSAIVVQLPFWRRLALRLRREHRGVLIYDCMDDWDTFENLGEFNRSEEQLLAAECDILAVTAEQLRLKFESKGFAPVLVRNGADFEFFCKASPLEDVPRNGKPVVGYFGAIADWIDLDLLYDVAVSRPQYFFVVAGEVFDRDIRAIEGLPNVRFLGSRPYEQMPSLLAAFDVCIIPFKLNQVTHATDPVKLYEYLSQGKPVVATAMQELRSTAELYYLAEGAAEFTTKLDEAVAECDVQRREARIDFARRNSWADRVEKLESAIRGQFPKVSVLLVTHNCADFIAPALRSVFRNEYPNLEVVLVDNHSHDDTVTIARKTASHDTRFRVEPLSANRGFAGGNNVAASMASGAYLVFLNADTVVTPGWVGRLLRHLEADRSIGLICPVTNFAGNEAKINIDYTQEFEMERFAMRVAQTKRGETRDLEVAALYCAMMRKDVFQQVGGLDERYEIGMFEDDDLSAKVKERGLRVVVAEDCFVHHFGQGSFSKLSAAEYNHIFDRNRKQFEAKWKRPWVAHRTRAGVRPALEEIKFQPDTFCR